MYSTTPGEISTNNNNKNNNNNNNGKGNQYPKAAALKFIHELNLYSLQIFYKSPLPSLSLPLGFSFSLAPLSVYKF